MVTNKQTTNQLGDPSASLPLTSVRRQSFAITPPPPPPPPLSPPPPSFCHTRPLPIYYVLLTLTGEAQEKTP